jgi:transglutaminase-like putative cysteine protease
LGDEPMDDFLFRTRRGFCEHYAYAFVLMMRAADIPARVVAGYQGGDSAPV